jgi:hypothetical protein
VASPAGDSKITSSTEHVSPARAAAPERRSLQRFEIARLLVRLDHFIIADNLSKAGWSWGCVSAIDSWQPIRRASAMIFKGKIVHARASFRAETRVPPNDFARSSRARNRKTKRASAFSNSFRRGPAKIDNGAISFRLSVENTTRVWFSSFGCSWRDPNA